MKKKTNSRRLRTLILILCIFAKIAMVYAEQPPMKLWYDKPATEWMWSALPIGNGEFGGMFFGGVETEQMQFNEKTLWTGSTTSRGAYQNFGDLYLTFANHSSYSNYHRELDLDEAIGRISYTIDGVKYLREYFASNPDSAIVMRITTPGSTGKLALNVKLKDAHEGSTVVNSGNITISGKLDILSYEAQVQVINEGGIVNTENDKVIVSNADAITLLLTGATNFDITSPSYIGKTADQLHSSVTKRITTASARTYADLKSDHLTDYQPRFNRVKIDFCAKMPSMPTDMLVRSYKENVYLDMLYYQYGRYLMLASSRGMKLPSNLQGIWNNNNNPPWQCDIHTNINVQMNYWPVEISNLSECHLPFLYYLHAEALKEDGSWQKVAKSEGLNRGWAVRTQTNIFGYTDWNINRPANAWYCMHLWQHYAYTNDVEYLRNIAFPVMKSACEYWFDRLIVDANGKLVAPNEWSPEQGEWEDNVAYAQQLIRELFDQTLKASVVVRADVDFINELTDKFNRLDNGVAIGSWGQIKEWTSDNSGLDVYGNTHRHLSHLMALYPGNQISYHLNEKFANAAGKSLESRGEDGTGWSRAWKIACWARLFDGNRAYHLLKQALNVSYTTITSMDVTHGGVYENLLDAHPPFQIDGNFGATAGITEMLLQSNLGFIHLLPALPSAWPNGRIEGVKAEGNFTVNISWKNALLTMCTVHSGAGKSCELYYPGIKVAEIKDKDGNSVAFDATQTNKVLFATDLDQVYTIIFARTIR